MSGGRGGGGGSVTGYLLGQHHVITLGPIDKCTRIEVGGKEAWTGDSSVGDILPGDTVATPGSIYIDNENLFGGPKKEGGIKGRVDILHGEPTQQKNPYLAQFIQDSLLPAYRLVASSVWRAAYIGTNPYLKSAKYRITRILNSYGGVSQWYQEKAAINTFDMNPAHIIREVMTSNVPDWGMNINENELNDTNFRSVADTLFNEGFGLSAYWSDESTGQEFIEDILRHINGALIKDIRTGIYELRLIRDDYDFNQLPVIDNSIFKEVVKSKESQLTESVNSITIEYWDRDLSGPSSVSLQNLSTLSVVGRINHETLRYPWVTNKTLAQRLLARELNTFATATNTHTIRCNKRGGQFNNADVVRLNIPQEDFEDVAWRILGINYTSDGRYVDLDIASDVFTYPEPINSTDSGIKWVDPVSEPTPVIDYLFDTASYYDIVKIAGEAEAQALSDLETSYQLLCVPPTSDVLSMGVFDTDQNEYIGTVPRAGLIVINQAISRTDTVLSIASITNEGGFRAGDYVIIGSERMEIESISSTTVTVIRGVEDTIPVEHNASARMYSSRFQFYPESRLVLGQQAALKVLVETGRGILSEASAPEFTFSPTDRQARPYPPANVQIGGSLFPSSINLGTDGNLLFSFNTRNRVQQTTGFVGWYVSHNVTSEDGVVYHYSLEPQTGDPITGESTSGGNILIDRKDLSTQQYTLNMWSMRGTIRSLQTFTHTFNMTVPEA